MTADAVHGLHSRDLGNPEVLALAGLRQAEDLFATCRRLGRGTAGRGSQSNLVHGIPRLARSSAAFEDTIQQVVALAALMPIVASIGGNTGNQTVALVVRGPGARSAQSRERKATSSGRN